MKSVSTSHNYNQAPSTWERTYSPVRWVRHGSYMKLQQYVEITSMDPQGKITGRYGEWRDVPTETEE